VSRRYDTFHLFQTSILQSRCYHWQFYIPPYREKFYRVSVYNIVRVKKVGIPPEWCVVCCGRARRDAKEDDAGLRLIGVITWKGSTHRLQFWRLERREVVMHPMTCHGEIKRTVHGRGTETQSFAVNRYQMGERSSRICESVGRSRVWLRKWIGRYDNSDKNSKKEWLRDKSRAPKNVHRKTDPEMEQLVVNARKSLRKGETEDTKCRCIGAVEAQLHMHELGHSEDSNSNYGTKFWYPLQIRG